MKAISSPYVPRGEAFVITIDGLDLAQRITQDLSAQFLKEDEFLAQRNFMARATLHCGPMMQERTQVERISVHATCGTRPVLVCRTWAEGRGYATWCPSCRTDVPQHELHARPYYETGPRRLSLGGPFLGSISA